MENNDERKRKIYLIIKIIVIIIIILLLIHNCGQIKNTNYDTDPDVINIDCKDDKCDAILKDLIISPVDIDFKTDRFLSLLKTVFLTVLSVNTHSEIIL